MPLAPAAAEAAQAQPVLVPPAMMAPQVAQARHHLFLAGLLPMQAAVARVRLQHLPLAQAGQVAVGQAQLGLQLALLVQPTRAAVAVAHGKEVVVQLPAQAAPASSSSNTTSALPRSSPSSPRSNGLHLRVR